MKIIKFPDEQKWYFKYALILFENYKDIGDKLDADIVCTLIKDRWYSKLFVNKWWYIPFIMINTPRHFMIKYVHGWYDIQFHDLCLGFINLRWEGSPGINKKRKKKKGV